MENNGAKKLIIKFMWSYIMGSIAFLLPIIKTHFGMLINVKVYGWGNH